MYMTVLQYHIKNIIMYTVYDDLFNLFSIYLYIYIMC